MNNYKDLKIWQKSMDLVEKTYLLMKSLPNKEKFGLIPQIKRSSISIPSNISEGTGRNSKKEFKHFLSIANGSTTELETQILLTTRLKFVEKQDIEETLNLCNEIKKMNYALQKSLTQNT